MAKAIFVYEMHFPERVMEAGMFNAKDNGRRFAYTSKSQTAGGFVHSLESLASNVAGLQEKGNDMYIIKNQIPSHLENSERCSYTQLSGSDRTTLGKLVKEINIQ